MGKRQSTHVVEHTSVWIVSKYIYSCTQKLKEKEGENDIKRQENQWGCEY